MYNPEIVLYFPCNEKKICFKIPCEREKENRVHENYHGNSVWSDAESEGINLIHKP